MHNLRGIEEEGLLHMHGGGRCSTGPCCMIDTDRSRRVVHVLNAVDTQALSDSRQHSSILTQL